MSGGDAPGGNTRSHPEHDGEDPGGRWYYAGDGMGEQAAAGLIQKNRDDMYLENCIQTLILSK